MPPSAPPSTSLLLRRALLHRRGRLAVALTCLAISAALVTALASLYRDLGDKLDRDFRAFGPNAVVTTKYSQPLSDNLAQMLSQQAGEPVAVVAMSPIVAETSGHTPQVVVGTDLKAALALHPEWKLSEHRDVPTGIVAAWFGARALPAITSPAALTLNGRTLLVSPEYRLQTGGAEDTQIYVDTPAFTQWTGKGMSVAEAHVPGDAAHINATIARAQAALPAMNIRPVRQLVEGQGHIVARTHSLMIFTASIVVATLAIAVLATLFAMVLDRRRDYAIMKALGCSASTLRRLFLLESCTLALAGAMPGIAIGIVAALFVGYASFHTRVALHPALWPAALAVNLVLACAAALLPLQRLDAIQPAALLRGE